MSDERAVEVVQLSQPAQTDTSQVSIGYYEPHQLTELANHGRLYLLADGVSGTTSGPVVSQYAVKKILHSFYTANNPDVKVRLLEAIQQANADIFERNQQNPERRVMATTLIAALFHGNKLLIATVGDSRVYVAWGQDIERLQPDTRPAAEADSTASPRLLTAEAESPKEAEPEKTEPTPPRRRMPQGLGLDNYVKIDTFSRRLFAGDTVILCSGGLTGYMTEKEMARAITRHPLEQAVQRLLALASERGNRDHVAISITRVLSSPVALRPPKPMIPPPEPNWSDWENLPRLVADRSPTKPDIPAAAKPDPAAQARQRLAEAQLQPIRRQSWRRWQPYAWAVFGLAFVCVVLLLVGRFVFPTELMAAVSFLRSGEISVAEETEPAIVVSTSTAGEIEAEPAQAQTEPTATLEVSASPQGEATLVAESISPLPTPEATFISPVITPTANLTSQEDTLPTATPSPQSVPTTTPSPTPLPTIEVPLDCTNKARFRQDITVPDGEQFAPAEAFEKVWLLHNAGTCPWGPGYTVRLIGGDTMGANSQAPLLDVTSPDSNGEIRVSMIAPAAAGIYRGDWQLYDLNGEPFGPQIYLEIEVVAPDPEEIDEAGLTTLFDFIEQAGEATWSSGETNYSLLEADISEALELPVSQGLIAVGPALLRGNVESDGNVLLTYPDRVAGFIEGSYTVDTPLQPTDALAATVGFIKLSILSDDGVTFEVIFRPNDGSSEQVILSRSVQYGDSPVTEIQPLTNIAPGQTGTFTLRVLGGESLSRDWAVWIDLRLVRLPAE